ncbi:MAG TPA: hypothetical protein VEK15_06545 [Vicinamibacteria bacterium]|nr:hypothetical protein [Vicinamibacteria bacterium]
MIAITFVEFRGLLKAGHATQPRCSTDEDNVISELMPATTRRFRQF